MKNGVVIYTRVSSEEQVEGFSLSVQKRECQEWAQKQNYVVKGIFTEEGVSGAKLNRPELGKILAFCLENKKEIAYMVVKDIDRIARDRKIYYLIKDQLEEIGIGIYSIKQPNIINDDLGGNLTELIAVVFSNHERRQLIERTTSGTKEAIRNHGAWTTTPPFGYVISKTHDRVSTLSPHPKESEAVVKTFMMYADGSNIVEIASKLHTLGYRTKRGKRISNQSIYHYLHNPVYIGKIRTAQFKDELIEGAHPAIIEIELWNRVQSRFSGKSIKRLKHNPAFPLTVTLKCSECGSPLCGSNSKSRSGKYYAYYHCRKNKCKSKNFNRDILEENFLDLLNHIMPTEEAVKLFEEQVILVHKEKWKDSITEKQLLERRLTELEQKRDAIVEKFIDNKISEDVYLRQKQKVDTEIINAVDERNKHLHSEEQTKQLLKFARKFLTSISNTWENGDIQRRKLTQRLVFPNGVTVNQDGTFGTLELPPLLQLLSDSELDDSSMVPWTGFEPVTFTLEGCCSIQLSYQGIQKSTISVYYSIILRLNEPLRKAKK